MYRARLSILVMTFAALTANAVPFWGAKASSPADAAPTALKPGYGETQDTDLASVVGGRVKLPQDFAQLIYPLLAPGTTMLVTDAPVLEEDTGRQVTVMGAGLPN